MNSSSISNTSLLIAAFIFIVIVIIVILVVVQENKSEPLVRIFNDDQTQSEITDVIYELRAALNGLNEIHPVSTKAFGIGIFRVNQTQIALVYDVYFTDIVGLQSIDIETKDGTLVKTLTNEVAFQSPVISITGTWTSNDDSMPLTEEIVKELIDDKLYLNIKTVSHPKGEIRGLIKNYGQE